jgi:hypothetical protein
LQPHSSSRKSNQQRRKIRRNTKPIAINSLPPKVFSKLPHFFLLLESDIRFLLFREENIKTEETATEVKECCARDKNANEDKAGLREAQIIG